MIAVNGLRRFGLVSLLQILSLGAPALAQVPPTSVEAAAHAGLHHAAHNGDLGAVKALLNGQPDLELRVGRGRTAVHVAAYASHEDVVRSLAGAGADVNALNHQSYDIVIIAAVTKDLDMLDAALDVRADPGNLTNRYNGTA